MPVKLKAEPWGFPWFSLSPVPFIIFIGSIWKCFASHFGYGVLSKKRLFQDGRARTSICPQELSWHESLDWRQPQELVVFLFQGPRVASCLEVWEILLSREMQYLVLDFLQLLEHKLLFTSSSVFSMFRTQAQLVSEKWSCDKHSTLYLHFKDKLWQLSWGEAFGQAVGKHHCIRSSLLLFLCSLQGAALREGNIFPQWPALHL